MVDAESICQGGTPHWSQSMITVVRDANMVRMAMDFACSLGNWDRLVIADPCFQDVADHIMDRLA